MLIIATSNTIWGTDNNQEWREVLESTIAQTQIYSDYYKMFTLPNVFTNVENLPEEKADLLFCSDTILVTYLNSYVIQDQFISIHTTKYLYYLQLEIEHIDYIDDPKDENFRKILSGSLRVIPNPLLLERDLFVDKIFDDEYSTLYDKYGWPLDLLERCLYRGQIPPPKYVWKYYKSDYLGWTFETFRIIRNTDNSFSIDYFCDAMMNL